MKLSKYEIVNGLLLTITVAAAGYLQLSTQTGVTKPYSFGDTTTIRSAFYYGATATVTAKVDEKRCQEGVAYAVRLVKGAAVSEMWVCGELLGAE